GGHFSAFELAPQNPPRMNGLHDPISFVIVDDPDVPCMTVLGAKADAPGPSSPTDPCGRCLCRPTDFNGLRSLRAAAAFRAANKSSAFSTSSPANLLLPSSANRRVALFAQDLIILAKYEALYVNEWRARGASSTPTPRSPETRPAAPCMRNRNHRVNRAIGNGRGHKFAK